MADNEAETPVIGRPSSYSEAIADAICDRIANGESLRTICTDTDMPSQSMVFRWLADDKHQLFREQYARARESQADALFDEILNIADDGTNDWMERKNADGENIGWRENGEALRRSALRVDARKWMAGKLQAKKYGDKIDLNVSGSLQTATDEQIDARLAQLIGKAGVAGSVGGTGETGEEA